MMRIVRVEGWVFFAAFIGTIWFANYLIGNVGTACVPGGPCLIPVWPGVLAPSGIIAAGLALTLRDLVQRRLGVRWSVVAVLCGAGLSALLSPALALASGAAFLASEMLDLAVYTPLQRRRLTLAVVASNLVGLTVDTVIFLGLAFGSLALFEGQVIGKLWMTALAIPIVHGIRRLDARRGIVPA